MFFILVSSVFLYSCHTEAIDENINPETGKPYYPFEVSNIEYEFNPSDETNSRFHTIRWKNPVDEKFSYIKLKLRAHTHWEEYDINEESFGYRGTGQTDFHPYITIDEESFGYRGTGSIEYKIITVDLEGNESKGISICAQPEFPYPACDCGADIHIFEYHYP